MKKSNTIRILGVDKLKNIDVLSASVMFSCVNIEYMNLRITGLQTLTFYMRLFLIVIIAVRSIFTNLQYRNIIVFGRNMFFVLAFLGIVLWTSFYNNRNVEQTFFDLSYALLPALYLDYYRDSLKLVSIIKTWEIYLLVLVGIDAVTMFLFPSGLYSTNSYTLNWFLGYKTMRLIYALPLCIFRVMLNYFFDEKRKGKTYGVLLLTTFTLVYSRASAAAIGLIVIFMLFIAYDALVNLYWGKKRIGQSINKAIAAFMSNYIWILPIYFAVFYLLLNISHSFLAQQFVSKVLNKDITLTNRTVLWSACVDLIWKKPMFGYGYMTADDNRILFNNMYYTSPHNMVLSVFMTAGIIGAVFYLISIIDSLRTLHKRDNVISRILVLGILCNLLVGITSSVLVFSVCGFIFNVLSETDFEKLKMKINLKKIKK